MKNKSVQNCQFVNHAKFHCITTMLNRLFSIEFERGETGKEPKAKNTSAKKQKPKNTSAKYETPKNISTKNEKLKNVSAKNEKPKKNISRE